MLCPLGNSLYRVFGYKNRSKIERKILKNCRRQKVAKKQFGAIAQLARVLDWQSRGHGFDSR